MNKSKVVFWTAEIYGIIKISALKLFFSGYTQKNKRCYAALEIIAPHGICLLGLAVILAVFQNVQAAASEPPILPHVESAKLITVSALANPESDALKLPAKLFSIISLIDSRGIVVSNEKENCSIINKYERFQFVSKGKIAGENSFGAKGYEAVITEDGAAGKLMIYSDTLFSSPFLYMRWRRVDAETEYLRRAFHAGSVTEEVLVIRQDGSGYYRAGLSGKVEEKLRWNARGEIIRGDEKH